MSTYLQSLLIVLLASALTACNYCKKLPAVPAVLFEVTGTVEQRVLYLEDQAPSKITLKITPKSKLAHKGAFSLADWSLPAGLQGVLLDKDGAVLDKKTRLKCGENVLFYKPLTAGHHVLKLHITDQYREHAQEVALAPIQVAQEQELPFALSLEPARQSLFRHEQLQLTLSIASEIAQAQKVAYTLEDLALTNGRLTLAESGVALGQGASLAFGSQELVFTYTGDTEQEGAVEQAAVTSTIKLIVRNAKGDLRAITIELVVQPVTFSIAAWLREPTHDELEQVGDKDVVTVVELMLLDVAEELYEETFELKAWSLPQEVTGVLKNDKQEPLTTFLLNGKEKHQLFLCLGKGAVVLGSDPKMILSIEGPGETVKEGEVDLGLAQRLSLDNALKAACLLGTRANDKKPEHFQYEESSYPLKQGLQVAEEYLADIQRTLDNVATHCEVACMPTAMQERYSSLLRRKEALEASREALQKSYNIWSSIEGHGGVQATVLKLAKDSYLTAREQEYFKVALGKLDKNAKFSDGYTALHHAVAHGNEDAFSLLIAEKAAVNVTGPQGETPLLLAVKGDNSQLTSLLLEAGGNPNIGMTGSGGSNGVCLDQLGWAPLHAAILTQNLRNVELLLAYGANPHQTFAALTSNTLARYNRSPAHLALCPQFKKSGIVHHKIYDALCAAEHAWK